MQVISIHGKVYFLIQLIYHTTRLLIQLQKSSPKPKRQRDKKGQSHLILWNYFNWYQITLVNIFQESNFSLIYITYEGLAYSLQELILNSIRLRLILSSKGRKERLNQYFHFYREENEFKEKKKYEFSMVTYLISFRCESRIPSTIKRI